MKILMISDNPERPSFHQIENLREVLQSKLQKKIDLLVFSQKFFIFNEQKIEKHTFTQLLNELKLILDRGLYSLFVISLEKSNGEKLFFSKDNNILDMISKYRDKSTVLIFTAQSVLNHVKEINEHNKLELKLYLFPRRGVSKISREFKQQVLKML